MGSASRKFVLALEHCAFQVGILVVVVVVVVVVAVISRSSGSRSSG